MHFLVTFQGFLRLGVGFFPAVFTGALCLRLFLFCGGLDEVVVDELAVDDSLVVTDELVAELVVLEDEDDVDGSLLFLPSFSLVLPMCLECGFLLEDFLLLSLLCFRSAAILVLFALRDFCGGESDGLLALDLPLGLL